MSSIEYDFTQHYDRKPEMNAGANGTTKEREANGVAETIQLEV